MSAARVLVPVSGGKDSQVCVALAVDRYGADRVVMAHQNTGFDHPVTYEHMEYMRERYGVPLVQVHAKKYRTVPDAMLGEMIIPSRWARMCTRQLKTKPWFEWLRQQADRNEILVLLGMRAQESSNRMGNYGHLANDDEFSMRDISSECPASIGHVRTQLPIVEWSTTQVFEFLRRRGDRVNPLYARGHKRVGCYPCVLAGKRDFELALRDPVGRDHVEQLHSAMIIIKLERPEIDETKFFDHDLASMLDRRESDPFGLLEAALPGDGDGEVGGCSWCNL